MQGNVQSIDAIRHLQFSVGELATAMGDLAADVTSEVVRARQWIESEAPAYWRRQLKRAERQLAEALDNLACVQQTVGGRDRPAATEAKQRVDRLKARVKTCNQKLVDVKKWQAEIERGSNVIATTTSNLQQQSGAALPQAEAKLEAWIRALDQYAGGGAR